MSKEFKPMRSCAPDEKFPITFPKLASMKLDGIRVCKFEGKTRTKSGKPLPNKHIRAFIEAYVPEGYDMEVISGDPLASDCYKKTFSAAMTVEGVPEFTLYVFDMCDDLKSFATERLARVQVLYDALPADVKERIVLVPQNLVNSSEEEEAFYTWMICQGAEGAILKDPSGFYKYGKCTAKEQTQLKRKPDEDDEALIVGVYEGEHNANEAFKNEVGETKRSTHQENKVPNGRLGGFNVVKDGVDFKVGPGKFTHEELKALWDEHVANPGCHNGKYIKYRSLGYGVDRRPRHPRALGFRDVVDMEPTAE